MEQTQGFLSEQICSIRKFALIERENKESDNAISTWIEDDFLLQGKGKALVIILNSTGCEWSLGINGGCSMCGYSNDTSEKISPENYIKQVSNILTKFSGKDFQSIKVFNSGSFFNSNEIPIPAQNEIIQMISSVTQVSEIIVESRPEYITKDVLTRVKNNLNKGVNLEIGIGLESSNDYIRINLINKGFNFDQFIKAVKLALANKIRIKSYLLFKPPFLSERDAIKDIIQSTFDSIKLGIKSISINPVNVQNGTLVSHLWRENLYRPPWFWSLREVLETLWNEIKKQNMQHEVDRILCDPSGGGTLRGIHNCIKCDKQFVKAIKDYSINQNISYLNCCSCNCFNTWKEYMLNEAATKDQSLKIVENSFNLL